MADPCLSLDRLEQLVREGSVGGAEGASAETHVRDCAGCRARLAEMRDIDRFVNECSLRPLHDHTEDRRDGGRRSTEPLGDLFPGYAIDAIIDVGGQGAIHRARQLATGRVVAIKVPLGDAVRRPAKRYRFRREIELTSRLDHPGVVRVYGVCEAPDGRIGCVMEFVEGRRFDEWAAERRQAGSNRGRDGIRQIVAATVKVAEAIAYAHQRGVLHRDLKPSNVLVTSDGIPRVLDFGLAKALDGGSGSFVSSSFVTVAGAFLGTLAYSAPEQVDGKGDEADVRTDVHGIGLLLFEGLAGRLPWDPDAAPPDLCAQIRRGEVARPTPLGGTPDAELDAIVLKALASDRERRYSSAALLAEDLEHWLAGRPVRARFDSRWYVVRKTAWRRRWWIAAAAIVLCVLAVFTALTISARSAATQATIAGAARDARALESHWALLADARAVARDEFTFGEQRAWDALLGAEAALVHANIEGPRALAHPFDVTAGGERDWSIDAPTSPAYWALWEIYLRMPVVASLPELVDGGVTFEPGSERLLWARGRALERWDWQRGRMHDRIELPLAKGITARGVVASGGRAVVTLSDRTCALVNLESTKVTLLPTLWTGGPILVGARLVLSADGSAGRDTRRVLELWSIDGETPHLVWSREFPFYCLSYIIDASGHFVLVNSREGDVVALDASTGATLLHRTSSDRPRFRFIGSRGRPGEAVAWGYEAIASFEWTGDAVSLTRLTDRHAGYVGAHGDYIKHFHPAPIGLIGSRFAVGLDRGGVAIGRTDRPITEIDRIPAVRSVADPRLSTDERHLLLRIDESQRRAILDLEPVGVIRLPHPAPVGTDGAATVFACDFDEDGTWLITTALDGSLRRHMVPSAINSTDSARDHEARHPSPAGIAVAPTDSTVVVRCDTATGLTCFAEDGATTYLGTHELGRRDAKLLRLRDGEFETLLDDRRSWYCGLAVEPKTSLWALGGDGRIFRMSLITGVIEAERRLAASPKHATHRTVARLAQRGLLIAGPGGRGVHVLDEHTLEPVCESVPMPPVHRIVVSSTDPDLLVTTHDSGVIRVWRVDGAAPPNVERSAASDVGARGDEGCAAASNEVAVDGPVRVELVREMGAHGGPVFCAAFHPSGRILATGGGAPEARDVRLWDLESGRELAALSLFEGGVFSVAFSPDGRWLAAVGEAVPGKFEEGGLVYLIDLTAAERCMAGNLEFHIARWRQGHGGQQPPQGEMLRGRFGGRGKE